jgi:hypothetical protein
MRRALCLLACVLLLECVVSVGGVGGAVASTSSPALRESVARLLAGKGALSPAVSAKLTVLDTLSPAHQAALAAVVDAFAAFDRAAARRAALASGPTYAEGLDDVLAARADLAAAVAALGPVARRESGSSGTSASAVGLESPAASAVQLPPWFSLSIGDHDEQYDNDIALLIDEGGDDLYLNNGGGSNLVGGTVCELGAVVPSPAAALVDLSGADRYWGQRSCGANGGGAALRAGFLYDAGAGADSYQGGDFGVNGGGDFGGVGYLYDEAGNSSYAAGKNGVNGGGSAGYGLLVDGGGDDTYTSVGNGANGGAQLGGGGLRDVGSGADRYQSGSVGTNGGANGGCGFLVDEGGNDTYTAGSIGVNGGGSAGAGLLLDAGGWDVYTDSDGGSGSNRTVVPKGAAGAQVDLSQ